ncbi:LysR family transcriptional regulator [Ensifer sp. M14]|uniref:LysR family transcriptional regulator n=1 Tax=Rhizobiaceae TaxID=82115 RepID=UPI000E1DE2C6|nr:MULTISPECIES: LysR family transcriptional regulator [Rhizobiaceae]MDS7594967.1 LysR family transcriptional regulator [Agrobacterium tumefaciens]RDL52787.1 HTH-type transcriptional regulator CynR [Ensifer sp. M14]
MRNNFEFLDLKAFLAVLDLGSFNEAARQLNLSQPALSRRIKGFEEAVGAQLIERTTRHVAPTQIGRELLPLVRRLVDEFEDSILSISDLGGRHRAQVTIASVPTAAFYFLPRVVHSFNEKFPGIRFRILDLSANEGLDAVANGEVEFGINITGAARADLNFTPLIEDPFVLACRRDHPLATAKSLTWADLAGHPLIGVSKTSGNRAVLDRALTTAQVQLNWFYEVNHLSTSLGLVEAGLGISVMPKLATPQLEHPVIATVPLKGPLVSRTIGLVERRGGRLSPAAIRFREMLIQEWTDC